MSPPPSPDEADPADAADPSDPTLPPSAMRALKQRLLERVADAEATHLTVRASQGAWQPFLPGVRIKVLHVQDGVMSYLLQLAPGAHVPPHRHRLDEECVVLDGLLNIGSQPPLGPGGYHLAHRGALHATLSTAGGATVFLRGAVPAAGDLLA